MNWLQKNTLLEEDRRGDRRGGRRGKQLLDELKETKKKNYRNSKELALNRALWRNHFARGYGLVARQTTLRTHNLQKLLLAT